MAARDFGGAYPVAGAPHPAEPDDVGFEDRLVQQMVGDDFDVLELVRAYPIPALLLAAAGGFWLGSSRGRELLRTVGDVFGSRVERVLETRLDL